MRQTSVLFGIRIPGFVNTVKRSRTGSDWIAAAPLKVPDVEANAGAQLPRASTCGHTTPSGLSPDADIGES